jgi:O-antigen/teichoic acid export membrane protein
MGVLSRIGFYTISKLAVMGAGMISFPILTRVLTPAEYGIMGLILTLLNLTIGASKLGLQFSTVRLWSQWDATEEGRQRFILSFFTATLLASLLVVALYDLGTAVLRPLIGPELTFYILLASPLVVIRALGSFGMSLLNAAQRSRTYAIFEVVGIYVAMALAVLGATVVIRGLTGYYAGLVLGEGLVIGALVLYTLRQTRFRRANLSYGLVREAVLFGIPMAIYENAGVLFFTGDRFIIAWLAGKTKLGYYTVAFNLSMYVNMLFSMPVMRAVTPAVTELYEKEGPEAATGLLTRAARWYFLFCFAAVAGIALVRRDLVGLLASDKFLPGADMAPILLAGLLFTGGREILGTGMFLKKRPWRMASLLLGGAALNAVLNIVLLPILGIEGAALATLVSQAAMALVFWWLGSRLVSVRVDLWALTRHVLCAGGMAAALYFVNPGQGVVRLLSRVGLGAAVFSVLVLLLDGEARDLARRMMDRLRGK